VVRANAKPTATPAALARRGAPIPSPSPASRGAHDEAKDRGRPTPAGNVDDLLAAAIKGVETRVGKAGTPGLSGAGPGGGQGGTERTLNGPAGVGGEGPGGGGAVRGLEFVVYYNQMLTRIKESWTYVGDRNDLRVTVRFSILDSGEITDIRLTERSGDPGYDASVERAIKRAGPLTPPPQAYRKDFADVELTFRPADLRRPSG
jgi:TonB family protein